MTMGVVTMGKLGSPSRNSCRRLYACQDHQRKRNWPKKSMTWPIGSKRIRATHLKVIMSSLPERPRSRHPHLKYRYLQAECIYFTFKVCLFRITQYYHSLYCRNCCRIYRRTPSESEVLRNCIGLGSRPNLCSCG